MRVCPKCGGENSTSSSYCPPCLNEYQKKWYRENPASTNLSIIRRRKALRNFIIEAKRVPCTDCGKEYPYYVMDFDHCRGRKLFDLSRVANKVMALEKVKREIKKCDVVCANCHRGRTFKRSEMV